MKIIVSGTGFSSILCINHLVKLGLKPTVLDIGNEIDSEKKILLKRESLIKQKNFDSFQCFGGLSRVWSGVIEKYLENDFVNWPISSKTLEIYYDEVIKNLEDCDLYSFYSSSKNDLLDYKIKKIDNLTNSEIYKNKYISIKYSNIFGKKLNSPNGDSINYENFQPYNMTNNIKELISKSKIDYRKEKIIKIYEEKNQVFVESTNDSKEIIKRKCDYLFMGCGCISSYLIMKNSIPNFDKNIKIYTPKQFVLPIKLKNIKNFKTKFFNSLPFFQINLVRKSNYSIYSQVYKICHLK